MTTKNSINTANQLIQYVRTSTASVVNCTTLTPNDDSIPQSGEGDEVITLAITPILTTSLLLIEFSCNLTPITTNNYIIGLFQDATANALTAGSYRGPNGQPVNCLLRHVMTSGTTSSTTFKIRIGTVTGVGQNVYVNGDATGTRLMGGVSIATFTIKEFYA